MWGFEKNCLVDECRKREGEAEDNKAVADMRPCKSNSQLPLHAPTEPCNVCPRQTT